MQKNHFNLFTKSITISWFSMVGMLTMTSFENVGAQNNNYGGAAFVRVKCHNVDDRYCMAEGDTRIIITEVGCRFANEAGAIGKLNEELKAKMSPAEEMDSQVEYELFACSRDAGQDKKYGGTASVTVKCFKSHSPSGMKKGTKRVIITEVGCRFANEAGAIGKLNEELNAKMSPYEKMDSYVEYQFSSCGGNSNNNTPSMGTLPKECYKYYRDVRNSNDWVIGIEYKVTRKCEITFKEFAGDRKSTYTYNVGDTFQIITHKNEIYRVVDLGD